MRRTQQTLLWAALFCFGVCILVGLIHYMAPVLIGSRWIPITPDVNVRRRRPRIVPPTFSTIDPWTYSVGTCSGWPNFHETLIRPTRPQAMENCAESLRKSLRTCEEKCLSGDALCDSACHEMMSLLWTWYVGWN